MPGFLVGAVYNFFMFNPQADTDRFCTLFLGHGNPAIWWELSALAFVNISVPLLADFKLTSIAFVIGHGWSPYKGKIPLTKGLKVSLTNGP